jgi:ADP-heptose:LPS heptosyltransferase
VINPKILLIRPDALGDVILMLPMITELRKKWRKAHITVLASAYTSPLLEVYPDVDEVWIDPFNKGQSFRGMGVFVQRLRAEKFDMVVHVFNEGPYVVSTWLAGIPIRVGDQLKLLVSIFHTHRVRQDFSDPWMHEVDLDLQLLKPFDIEPPEQGRFDWAEVVFPGPPVALQPNYVVIHPGVGRGNRSIPEGLYRGLIEALSTKGLMAVLTGGQAEKKQNAAIAKGLKSAIDFTGQTDLLQLAGIIQKATIMVSVDTGPMHLAASLGVRILNLSPSKYVKPTRWGPYGVSHCVIRPESICSYRCFPYTCKRGDCTEAFDPSSVQKALSLLLSQPGLTQDVRDSKRLWVSGSMPVLDLRKNPSLDFEGYRYFKRSEVKGFLWRWAVVQDIGFFIVDRPRLWHIIMSKILALWLYYPPRFVLKVT